MYKWADPKKKKGYQIEKSLYLKGRKKRGEKAIS